MCVSVCGGREGGGGGEFRGRAPVWDTCSMEFLGEDKADGSSTAVGERQQTYPPLSHTLPPLKSMGPSCVTKMKQEQTASSEPSRQILKVCVSFLQVVKRTGSGRSVHLKLTAAEVASLLQLVLNERHI